jgi:hypothetical protein
MALLLFYIFNGLVTFASVLLGGFFGWLALEAFRAPSGLVLGLILLGVFLIAWSLPVLSWFFFFRNKLGIGSLVCCGLATGWCFVMGFYAGTVAFGVANP